MKRIFCLMFLLVNLTKCSYEQEQKLNIQKLSIFDERFSYNEDSLYKYWVEDSLKIASFSTKLTPKQALDFSRMIQLSNDSTKFGLAEQLVLYALKLNEADAFAIKAYDINKDSNIINKYKGFLYLKRALIKDSEIAIVMLQDCYITKGQIDSAYLLLKRHQNIVQFQFELGFLKTYGKFFIDQKFDASKYINKKEGETLFLNAANKDIAMANYEYGKILYHQSKKVEAYKYFVSAYKLTLIDPFYDEAGGEMSDNFLYDNYKKEWLIDKKKLDLKYYKKRNE